jgi:predicted nucleic acid-binding protein
VFLLDTNVVSQFRLAKTGRAETNVVAWAQEQDPGRLFLSALTLFEVELGIRQIERRDPLQGAALRNWSTSFLLPEFSGRILPIDDEVVLRAAGLHVPNPAPLADSLIAATALVHRLTMVTRNVRDFAFPGLAVVNPWE